MTDHSVIINCKFYGSMTGCANGDTCPFSHAHPESVPLCPYEQHDYCRYGNKCCFRHSNKQNHAQIKANIHNIYPVNKLVQAEQLLKQKNSLWHTCNSNKASNNLEIFFLVYHFFNRNYLNNENKVFTMRSTYIPPSNYRPLMGTHNYILNAIRERFNGILIDELRKLYSYPSCKSIIHSIIDTESIQQFELFLNTCHFADAITLDGKKYVCGYSNRNYKLQLIEFKPCLKKYEGDIVIKTVDYGYSLRFYDASKYWSHVTQPRIFDLQRLGLFNEMHVNNDDYYFDELLLEMERVTNNPYRCVCEYSFCEFWIDVDIFPNGYMALYDEWGWQWIKKTNLNKLGYNVETCRKQEKDITEWMEYYDRCKKELFCFCVTHSGMYQDIVAIIVDFIM